MSCDVIACKVFEVKLGEVLDWTPELRVDVVDMFGVRGIRLEVE